MTNLTGTEKQISWGKDIRNMWIERLETLKNIAEKEDTKETKTITDPLSGTSKEVKNVSFKMTEEESATLERARKRFTDEKIITVSGTDKKGISSLIKVIEIAIETETDSNYWIDRR